MKDTSGRGLKSSGLMVQAEAFRDERPRIASFKTHFVKYFYPRVTALQRRRAHPNKALRKLYRLAGARGKFHFHSRGSRKREMSAHLFARAAEFYARSVTFFPSAVTLC